MKVETSSSLTSYPLMKHLKRGATSPRGKNQLKTKSESTFQYLFYNIVSQHEDISKSLLETGTAYIR